jgi:hypothetical protein
MDWHGLALDRQWTGTVFGWIGLRLEWVDPRLAMDWHLIDNRSTSDWQLIGVRLGWIGD